jgi:hypothetical protein
VNEEHVFFGGGLGLQEIGSLGEMLKAEAVANKQKFLGGENVVPQVQIVTGMVDELEREHS